MNRLAPAERPVAYTVLEHSIGAHLRQHFNDDRRVRALEYRGLTGVPLPRIVRDSKPLNLTLRLYCEGGVIWHAITDGVLSWMYQPLDDRKG